MHQRCIIVNNTTKGLVFGLYTERSSYIFGVNQKGALQSLHWGAVIRIEDCIDKLTNMQLATFDAELEREREEFSPWGGLSYVEPTLKLEYPDGNRDLCLQYVSHEIDTGDKTSLLSIILKDPKYPCEVVLYYKVIKDYDLIERWVEIKNKGKEAITLESVLSAAWNIPLLKQYRFTHTAGRWGMESQLKRTILTEGKKIIESRRGITSHQTSPWFALDNGEASETYGEVWFGALAWSGNWKITVENSIHGFVRASGGINDFDFRWILGAGESFRSPMFVGGYSAEGFGLMSRHLHHYQYNFIIPSQNKLTKVLYNSWEATTFNVNISQQVELARKASAIGVELFVIDDGWFGQRNDDRAGLGDWYVNPQKFPDGLSPLIEQVNALEMDFGIWVEPEMVNPDSDLYRVHPDWVLHFPNRERSEARNQLVLNIGKPEVQEFILSFMTDLLSKHNIKFVKWDMNRPLSEPGWLTLPHEKQREVWVRYVQSLYFIWQTLRKRFPTVMFESCSGGGGRIDLGIMNYADEFWTSDNTDPLDRLKIQEGYSYAYNPKAMMCWVTDAPNYMNGRKASLSFRFHSAMMGSLGIGGNLGFWSEEDLKEAKEHITVYKEIRSLIQNGFQYRLSSPSTDECTAMEYVNSTQTEAVVFAFRQGQQFGNPAPSIKLQGLDKNRLYHVDYLNATLSGAALMYVGIRPALYGDLSSQLIRIKSIE